MEKLDALIFELYHGMEMRGILTSIGLRSTIGSIDSLPPART